jgi:hypothetical protein
VAAPTAPSSRPFFDPGWLFLLAGLALLGSLVIIPAYEDVAQARFRRDLVLAIEKHRENRMSRYEEFIGAVDNREPSLLVSLAESQLNQIPTDRGALPFAGNDGKPNASVFPSLEPEPLVLPERTRNISRLEELTTGERSRPFVLLVGAICVLLGLLPTTRSRG